MKKSILIGLALVASFSFGFTMSEMISKRADSNTAKRATGIGGIFFKSRDPKKLREWYHAHLGLNTNPYGAVFEWHQGADSTKKGFTQWSPFKETTKYFEPSPKDFMINYRVENLEALLSEFRKDNIVIADTVQSVEYGKFVHILDLEGNKIELWEPNDVAYERMGKQLGSQTTK